ncbi:MAG: DUF2508 family protein [bacterium]|jgi:hypothetical protein
MLSVQDYYHRFGVEKMWEWLGKVISRIICWLLPENPNVGNAQGPDFFSIMDQAKQEREDARIYFNSVTDPDLIDHAIYLQDAAEKKFMYLIKTAKRNGITLSVPEMAESHLSYGFDVRG